jgi:hypothetical protein
MQLLVLPETWQNILQELTKIVHRKKDIQHIITQNKGSFLFNFTATCLSLQTLYKNGYSNKRLAIKYLHALITGKLKNFVDCRNFTDLHYMHIQI